MVSWVKPFFSSTTRPLSSEHNTYKTVTARIWRKLSSKIPQNLLIRSTSSLRNCNPITWRDREREFFVDKLLVRIHSFIVMIRWTGLAPWKFELPFSGSLPSTFLWSSENIFSGDWYRRTSLIQNCPLQFLSGSPTKNFSPLGRHGVRVQLQRASNGHVGLCVSMPRPLWWS